MSEMNEQFPEPPLNNEYARCILSEHQPVALDYEGRPECDVVAQAVNILYKHDHPVAYRAKIAGAIFIRIGSSAFQAFTGLRTPIRNEAAK